MARHVRGPLYYERMGRTGPVMAFLHPNPMDQSCWIFQMAHFSTWYRCLAIDIPGYGRSPRSDPGLRVSDIAEACWDAVDDAFPGEPAILVGCSAGSQIAPEMYHAHPARTLALALAGTGLSADGTYAPVELVERRIRKFTELGVAYRWQYVLEMFSPKFRTTPLAHFFADLFAERNKDADAPSIIYQYRSYARPRGDSFYSGIRCPTIILTGTEDADHQRALELKDHIPGCELEVLPGAGHAVQLEQPWLFDRLLITFLRSKGLLS